MTHQLDLLSPGAGRPEGFRYQPGVVDPALEAELLGHFRGLPFAEFEFRGYRGKRRVVSYGWRYDFNRNEVAPTQEIPSFLLPLREIAAAFAGLPDRELEQVLVSEYGAGAAIGWHRDKAVFGDVIGISFLSPGVFRMRRAVAPSRWERYSFTVEPRSAYLLRGPARTEWEHSIPPVAAPRYSVTFRQKARQ